MSDYPKIAALLKYSLEHEEITLRSLLQELDTLNEQVYSVNSQLEAQRERVAEIKRWLAEHGE